MTKPADDMPAGSDVFAHRSPVWLPGGRALLTRGGSTVATDCCQRSDHERTVATIRTSRFDLDSKFWHRSTRGIG